jgi:hypothetical protein
MSKDHTRAERAEIVMSKDVGLLEHHTIREQTSDGLKLTLKEDIMPDGKPCVAVLQGVTKLDGKVVQTWFNYVRGEYDARENKQEAEAAQRKEASRTGGGGAHTGPVLHGGSSVATEAAVQEREASVEAILQAKIASTSRSITFVEEQIAATMAALDGLKKQHVDLETELGRVVRAIKALREV